MAGGTLGLITRLNGKMSSKARTMSDFLPWLVASPPSCATAVEVASPPLEQMRSHPPFFLA